MRVLLIFILFLSYSFSASNVYECNQIFNQRKDELSNKIEKIDEDRQAYQALRAATNALFDKKKKMLAQKEKDINATLEEVKQKEKNIQNLLAKNKELLQAIKVAKDDKITATYSKMKDQAAAQILSSMSDFEASKILFNLKPKKISKVMAKMSPQKASKITEILLKGPPFKLAKKDKK